MNYIIFDESMRFLNAGFVAISEAAGSDFELLNLNNIYVDKNGFIYIYVSNESNVNVNVYFDDMKVTHFKSEIVQADDYYPFGLTLSGTSYLRIGDKENRYKFRGQELQYDLGLNWYQFKYRMHDPELGRFMVVDPLSEKYYYNSPYAFSENKVTAFVEMEGLEAVQPLTPDQQSRRQKNAEATFLFNHPIAGIAIGQYKEGSKNISTAAANFAINATRSGGFNIAGEGSDRNAVSHGVWQAIITRDFGKDLAETAGFSHEGFNVPDVGVTDKGYTTGVGKLAEADQIADLFNNIIGQNIGGNNPDASNVDLTKAVLKEFKENGMWTVQETEIGYSITRTKISDKQYQKAVQNVQSLNENGLSENEKKKDKKD